MEIKVRETNQPYFRALISTMMNNNDECSSSSAYIIIIRESNEIFIEFYFINIFIEEFKRHALFMNQKLG